jgi:DNA-directed RNA polymerase subunit N (RpoN/RPB10)
MGNLDKVFFNREFLDDWYRNYKNLEEYCEQRSASDEMEDELAQWVEKQRGLRHLLPKELNQKLSGLVFDFEGKIISWDSMYRQLSNFVLKNGHTYVPVDQEHEKLRDWIIRQILNKSLLSEKQIKKLNNLGVDWDMPVSRDHRWELMFLRLRDFYNAYGHCRVPQKWRKDIQLAHWVQVQRRMYTQGKLREDREQKLNSIDFIWNIKTIFDSQWKQYYQELESFCQKHGHCRVPGKYVKLAGWIERQRTAKAKNILPADRERMLEKINFIWDFKDIKKKEWDEKYSQLLDYKQRNGHSFVPVNFKENRALGIWVATQRRLEAKGKLDQEKKKKLNKLGFVWSRDTQRRLKSIYEQQWEASFAKLKAYKKAYGTCQISLKIDPVLQRWTCWQRKAFYEGKLSQDRLDRLNEIRFPWSIQEGYWMKMYDALLEFKGQFGHTRVPFQWPTNHKLADWVYRTKVNKSKLSIQKVELLNDIGFDWNLSRRTIISWKDMYTKLVKYKREHGHTRVPVKWQEDPKLGKWVSRMRSEREDLEPERVALLEALEFDWGYRFTRKNTSKKSNYKEKTEVSSKN